MEQRTSVGVAPRERPLAESTLGNELPSIRSHHNLRKGQVGSGYLLGPQQHPLSTNATCQQPKNSQLKTWGPATPNTFVMLALSGGAENAAVNKTGVWSWGKKVVAPRRGRVSNFSARPADGIETTVRPARPMAGGWGRGVRSEQLDELVYREVRIPNDSA